MIDIESCRQNAVDCLQQAQADESPEGRNILLNVALAWLRLGRQVQAAASDENLSPGIVPEDILVSPSLEQPKDETVSA